MVTGVVCDVAGSVISGIAVGVMAQVILGVIGRVDAAVPSTSPSGHGPAPAVATARETVPNEPPITLTSYEKTSTDQIGLTLRNISD